MRPRRKLFRVACGAGLLLASLLVITTGLASAQDFDPAHRWYDGVLKEFVHDGRVDYIGLKANPKALDHYLADMARLPESQFNSWSGKQRLACLVNLYNAATLRLILDHAPVRSIKDIGSFFKGPWDQPAVHLSGRTITLNTLEHEILRKQYNEPRIHMALVCAAMGCPSLRSEAYTAENLDAQLDDQAKRFLANPAKFRIDPRKGVLLSPIFKWYGADFRARYTPRDGFAGLTETERAVLNFCGQYLSSADREHLASGGYPVGFLDYDWSLNEIKLPQGKSMPHE